MTVQDRPISLWEKKDKNGNTYFSGTLPDNRKVQIFKNTFKEAGSNQPDYKMRFLVPEKKPDATQTSLPLPSMPDELPF